jgi:RHS repeat-associated protein
LRYYPFGLIMAGISSKAAGGLINKNKYNGIEHNEDLGLNMYDAFYRNLDPQLGRFWQVDPETESLEDYSPYASMYNNPISNVDPLGDFGTKFGAKWHRFWHGGGKIEQNEFGEWSVNKTKVETTESGETVVTGYKYYGKGRDQYSKAREELAKDYEIMADIQRNGDKSMYQMYDSPQEAGKGALSLGTGVLIPNPIIRSGTIAVNTARAAAAASNMANKSITELRALVGGGNAALFRQLFKVGPKGAQEVLSNIKNVKIPEGLTKEAMQAYRELINRVPDPAGTQAIRAKILDELLK